MQRELQEFEDLSNAGPSRRPRRSLAKAGSWIQKETCAKHSVLSGAHTFFN